MVGSGGPSASPNIEELNDALAKDKISPRQLHGPGWLFLFLGPQDQVVLILYADCLQLNFFADEARAKRVVAMSKGFCRLLDWLQRDPFENLRNFPLQKGEPVRGVGGLYSCQESVDEIDPPKFAEVPSFNYEAAAAYGASAVLSGRHAGGGPQHAGAAYWSVPPCSVAWPTHCGWVVDAIAGAGDTTGVSCCGWGRFSDELRIRLGTRAGEALQEVASATSRFSIWGNMVALKADLHDRERGSHRGRSKRPITLVSRRFHAESRRKPAPLRFLVLPLLPRSRPHGRGSKKRLRWTVLSR